MSDRWTFPKYEELNPAVQRFFEILDTVEVSNNDREFHPVTIGSCRVYATAELGSLLWQMKVYSGYYNTRPYKTIREEIQKLEDSIKFYKKTNKSGYYTPDIEEMEEKRSYLLSKAQEAEMREWNL